MQASVIAFCDPREWRRRVTKPQSAARDIDAILNGLSPLQRNAWERIRRIVLEVAPAAEIGVIYNLPGLRILGRGLVAFGAAKNHCSLFPMSGTIVARLASELEGFETSKGTIRFSPKKPIPAVLMKRIVQVRLAEIEANTAKPKRRTRIPMREAPSARRKGVRSTLSR